MKFLIRKYLSKADLKTISEKIADTESKTSGEIRVVLRHRRSWRERKLSLDEIALAEFTRLGMQRTKDRTGVLVLLLMSERKFHIIADEGIHTKVESGTWDRIAVEMSSQFKEGKFAQGISAGVEAVGRELSAFFPRKLDDHDELSNEVVEQ